MRKVLKVMIEIIILHILKNINHIFFAVLLTKLYVLMINFANQLFFTEKKYAIYKFIEAVLKEYDYCRKIKKEHSDKNLFMSAEYEIIFQSSNKS